MVQVTDSNDCIIIPDTIDLSNPNITYFYFDSDVNGKARISTGGQGTEAYPDEWIPFDIFDPTLAADTTQYLDPSAKVGYDVIDVTARTESGTATVGFYIRGATEGQPSKGHGRSIGNMDPVLVTDTPLLTEAFYPWNNTVKQTDELIMFVAEESESIHLRGNVRIRRN
jgi:hypothetical protein